MSNPPLLTDVHFEQTPERLKIVLPVKRNIPLVIIYTIMVLIWLGMMLYGIYYTVQIAFSGESYAIVFAIMLVVFLYLLYRFGRYLLRQWSYFIADREILFINKDVLILRRPVSVFGNTDAFDMEHVTPFYISEKPASAAFDYGYRHYYFGAGLLPQSAAGLIDYLNQQYFPDRDQEDTAA